MVKLMWCDEVDKDCCAVVKNAGRWVWCLLGLGNMTKPWNNKIVNTARDLAAMSLISLGYLAIRDNG